MATLIEMYSHKGDGVTAVECIESRRGHGDSVAMESWEERLYEMQFSDTTWNSIDARNATGVPAYGSVLTGTAMYLTEKSVEPDPSDQTIVRVRVMFKTLRPNERQPHINGTSSIWSVVKSIEQFPSEQRIDVDLNGKLCINVLGEAMQPPVTELVYDSKIVIRFITNASAPQYWAWQTQGNVNNDAFTMTIGTCGYPFFAGTMFFQEYTINDSWDENGSKCAECAFHFLARNNGTSSFDDSRPNMSLYKSILSSGTMTLNADGTPKMTPILAVDNDTTQGYITEPKFLSSVGQPIPQGGTATLNWFHTKLWTNFTGSGTNSALLTGLLL